MRREIAGCILVCLYVVILFLLSAIVSYIVCACFGLKWTWLSAAGTMTIWIALLVTIYMALGRSGEEEE